MRIVEFTSIDKLPGLRLAWRSLLSQTPRADCQQSCEWLETVYAHQPDNCRLRILLVTGGGENVGILPLVVTTQTSPLGRLRVLSYLSDPWSPVHGPIGPQPTATLMTVMRYLSEQQDWDVLDLGRVNCSAADDARTRTALEVANMRYVEHDESAQPLIRLSSPSRGDQSPGVRETSEFQAARHPSTSPPTFNFQRYRPRGSRYADAEPRGECFERCLDLCGDDPDRPTINRDLLRELHVAACRSGSADLNMLWQGRQLAACCYNVHQNGTLLTLFSAAAPSSDRRGSATTISPSRGDRFGTRREDFRRQLLVRMLQDSVARHGDQNWLPGSEFSGAGLTDGASSAAEAAGEGCGTVAQLSWLRRARFVHDRRHGARRMIGQLANWLARPT